MDGTDVTARSLYMLPIGHQWQNKPGITLIGDTAHLMTPFAGEGVNMAMKDALDPAEALVLASSQNFEDVTERITRFERSMFKRASTVQRLTYHQMDAMLFTPGAPYTTIERYISHAVTDEMSPIVGYIVSAVIYTKFFIWKLFGLGKGLPKTIAEESHASSR
jgi:2-polyprenyl-6-methoxyphenol hydroxylase-like FAD-dependent oxidoreductase